MTTPTRLKQARKALKLSQAELATALGLSRKQTVSDWENGRQEPQPYVWLALERLICSGSTGDLKTE